MTDIDNDEIKKLIHKIGLKYNLRDEVVNKILVSQYRFIRETISELKIKDIDNKDDFDKLNINFNILHLGKLYISLERLLMINKKNKND